MRIIKNALIILTLVLSGCSLFYKQTKYIPHQGAQYPPEVEDTTLTHQGAQYPPEVEDTLKPSSFVSSGKIIIQELQLHEMEPSAYMGSTVLFPNGYLAVYSTPSEAKVYIGTLYIGNTPMETKAPLGQYPIKVSKEGYESYKDTLEIKSGFKTRCDVLLREE